jgi:hypothetical protein
MVEAEQRALKRLEEIEKMGERRAFKLDALCLLHPH